MFAVDCPRHGGTTLVFPSQITAMVNTETGIHVHFRCTCGTRGVWVTGRNAEKTGVHWLPAEADDTLVSAVA